MQLNGYCNTLETITGSAAIHWLSEFTSAVYECPHDFSYDNTSECFASPCTGCQQAIIGGKMIGCFQ